MKIIRYLLPAGLLVLHAVVMAGTGSDPLPVDFTRPEPGEDMPAGAATHRKMINRDVFSHASANMNFERKLDFKIGNGFFRRFWATAPSSTQAADGLGPLYNARACQNCHLKDGRGHPPAGPNEAAVSMFLRLSIPPRTEEERRLLAEHRSNVIPEPTYGAQLQNFAIRGIKPEGQMRIEYEEIPIALKDGTVVSLRKPTYRIDELAYGDLDPATMLSPRVAPPMIGLGLLEMIDERDILAAADSEDGDGDGISGRPNRVWSLEFGKVMLGRFGWKAGVATVNEQGQAAFSGDIGISVPLFPAGAGECTERQGACRAAPDGNSPQYDGLEAGRQVTDLVAFYSRNLAVPARRDYDHADVLEGKRIFYQSGCADCHRPKYRTRTENAYPELSGQLIWPYTDMLLHDMGEDLADHRPEGAADGREWRTAPLWGIGLTPVVSEHPNYLHDGRARSLLEAILWHGGEARRSRDAVAGLSGKQRELLIRFVESL